MATTMKKKRRGRPRAAQLMQPDLPYTMKLPDGRTVFVEVPGRWVSKDRSGEIAFLPGGVHFLDRVRALALTLHSTPSPGFISSLREAVGLTQAELGERIGVDKLTVSRWERGALRPSDESLAKLEKLRADAVRRGVVIPG